MMENLLRCERPEMAFDGTVIVEQGSRRRQLDGMVRMEVVEDLTPEQGCLVWVGTSDSEPILIGGHLENSQVWLRLLGYDELPLHEIEGWVDGQDFELEGEYGDRLEMWFSDIGEPDIWDRRNGPGFDGTMRPCFGWRAQNRPPSTCET